MPLTREALQAKIAPHANRCAVQRVHDTLNADEREALDEALALPAKVLPAKAIRELLRDECGVTDEWLPSIDQLNDHRARPRGGCKCPR